MVMNGKRETCRRWKLLRLTLLIIITAVRHCLHARQEHVNRNGGYVAMSCNRGKLQVGPRSVGTQQGL